MKKNNRKLFIIGLILCSAIFIYCTNKPLSKAKRDYIGTLTVNNSYNNTPVINLKCLIYKEYLFETQETLNTITKINTGKDGSKLDQQTSHSKSITGYSLSNFKDSTCTLFDTDTVHVIFKSVVPIADKKLGLHFKNDSNLIIGDLNDFVFLKDTVINQNSYKLLVYNSKKMSPGNKLKKIILYSNNNLKDFPFHPISKTLDDKFGGVIDKMLLFSEDGQSFGTEYTYENGLSGKDKIKVLKFIDEAKKHKIN